MTANRARLDYLLTLLLGWPRWLAVGICLACTCISVLHTQRNSASTSQLSPVVVATHQLTAGIALTSADLRMANWPTTAMPSGAIRKPGDVVGRRLADRLPSGEPIVVDDLLDTSIASALAAGRVATTVTLSNPNQAAIVHQGAVIDLYPGPGDRVLVSGTPVSGTPVSGTVRAIARNVAVLSVLPDAHSGTSGDQSGGLNLVIATDRTTAAQLADHPSGTFLATLTSPP